MKSIMLLIAASLGCLTLSSHAALLAHYKFDESAAATLAVDELGGTSGAIGTAITTGVTGISGNAYSLPDIATGQTGIVDMGDASFFAGVTGLNASTQLSYSVWMNSTDSDPNRNTILYSGSSTVANSYQDLGICGQTDAPTNAVDGAASVRNRPVGASASSGQQSGVFSSPVLIDDGKWHHLVMTVDLSSALMTLYVDGTSAVTQDFSGGTVAFPVFNNFEIGRLGRQGTPVDSYGGLVDDVQIYNTALTASEVGYLFANPGKAVPEPGTWLLAALGLLPFAFRRRA